MEDMLIVWLQDLMHKRILIGASAIGEQALYYYIYLKEENENVVGSIEFEKGLNFMV